MSINSKSNGGDVMLKDYKYLNQWDIFYKRSVIYLAKYYNNSMTNHQIVFQRSVYSVSVIKPRLRNRVRYESYKCNKEGYW